MNSGEKERQEEIFRSESELLRWFTSSGKIFLTLLYGIGSLRALAQRRPRFNLGWGKEDEARAILILSLSIRVEEDNYLISTCLPFPLWSYESGGFLSVRTSLWSSIKKSVNSFSETSKYFAIFGIPRRSSSGFLGWERYTIFRSSLFRSFAIFLTSFLLVL